MLDTSLDSKKTKKAGATKGEDEEEESLNYLLCVLIGYFVSTVSHDLDEWLTWGRCESVRRKRILVCYCCYSYKLMYVYNNAHLHLCV